MRNVGERADRGVVRADGRVDAARTPPVRLVLTAAVAVLVPVFLVATPAAAVPTTTAAPDAAPTAAATDQATAAPVEQRRGASGATTGDASAAASPTPSTTPSTTPPTTPSATVPTDPTIADPGDVTTSIGRFRGTATPGHLVRVSSDRSGSVCTTTAAADGMWSCLGPLRSGPEQAFRASDATTTSLGIATAPPSDVVTPPAVTTDRPTSGTVAGTGYPGALVSVAVTDRDADTTAVVDGAGRWATPLTSGRHPVSGAVTVTATQTAGTALGYRSELRSSGSDAVRIDVDRTAPDAPRITAPSSGGTVPARRLAIRGTGETAGSVTVYADDRPVCRATVADGTWTCVTGTGLPVGSAVLTALQQDTAGNTSAVSAAVRVTVRTAGAPTADPTGAGPVGRADPTVGPHGTGSAGTGGHEVGGGAAAPTTGAPSGSSGTNGSLGAVGPGGPADGVTGTTGRTSSEPADWSVATSYDAALPSVRSVSWRTLLVAIAVAAAFLTLVAVPIGLVTRSTPVRRALRARLTGRNQPRTVRSVDAAVPQWVGMVGSVCLTAVLVLLATGVAAEARYARLAIAVLLGSAALTAAVVLASRWAAGPDRHAITFRLSPWLLVAAVVAAVVTRSAGLSPAVVLGVLLVPTIRRPDGVAARRSDATRGRDATWRALVLTVLAVVGWLVHSALSASAGPSWSDHGVWTALASETAITLCVGGIGSLVTTLLPVAGSAGAALWSTSRARYGALAALALALAAAVYSGPGGTHVPLPAMTTTAVLCAVAGLGAWAVLRSPRRSTRG